MTAKYINYMAIKNIIGIIDQKIKKIQTNDSLSILGTIGKSIDEIQANDSLMAELRNSSDWKTRCVKLEQYIFFVDNNFKSMWDKLPRVREQFLYEAQQKLKMDFGFCEYFTPALVTKSMDNECAFYHFPGGQGLPTKCEGTEREFCCLINPKKEKVHDTLPLKLANMWRAQVREW